MINVYLKRLSGILHHIQQNTKITSANVTGRPAEIRHLSSFITILKGLQPIHVVNNFTLYFRVSLDQLVNSYLAGQRIPFIYRTKKSTKVFTKTSHLTLLWSTWIHFHLPNLLRPILISTSHPRMRLVKWSLPCGFSKVIQMK